MAEGFLHQLYQLHFQYTEQFLTALLPMSLTVVLHGQGMSLTTLYLRRFRSHATKGAHFSMRNLMVVVIVAIMLFAHFIEVVAWALFYFLTGMLGDFNTAMYYSINAYTTLGASNIELAGNWKGLGGFESMTGMLMFGWSTAVLAAIVQKTHSTGD